MRAAAYETLCDPRKRRAFDSIVDDDFDDIPTGLSNCLGIQESSGCKQHKHGTSREVKCCAGNEEGDFFAVYAPVFERFALYSETKPVPVLGEDEDEISEASTSLPASHTEGTAVLAMTFPFLAPLVKCFASAGGHFL